MRLDQIRKKRKLDKTLVSGPGALAEALGIDRTFNGISLDTSTIWIEKREPKLQKIWSEPRLGVNYAGSDALLPWRLELLEERGS